jgi:choline dehydrogenase
MATGVQYATVGGDLTGKTITANREVILTGGAIGSPHMLMMSGIGPKANLESVGVRSVHDLPGVGQHVTDHLASEVIFKTTAATAASEAVNNTLSNGTETFFSFVNSAIAYANITDLFGDYAPEFKNTISANLSWAVENVCPSSDPTVKVGYSAVHSAVSENFILSPIGHVELLLGLTGTAQGGDNSIAIQAALQHPFSTGQIYLNSSNPWEYPVIDPNYLAHPADTWLIREGLKLARKIGNTAPLSTFMTGEIFPGTAVQTDAEWDAWLAKQVKTEYHPSSSCSMMPLDHGGVVGADLKVHGISNLRVADSSVFPVQFAAHLQSLVYGVGEIASQMIKDVSTSLQG